MAFITCLGFTKLFLRLEQHFKLCAATLDVSSPSCLVPLAIKNSDLILFQRLSLRIQRSCVSTSPQRYLPLVHV